MEPEEIKEQLTYLKGRIVSLEQEQHRIDIQLVEIKSDLHYIRSGQDSLNNNLAKFLWIVGGGFIAAIVTFIIRGGLNGQ
jgi:prefoldin subunit 5